MNAIGQNVSVFWPDENEWFPGVVDQYNVDRGFHIQYFDGDDEWLRSLGQDVRFEDPNFVLDEENAAMSTQDMTSEAKYVADDMDFGAEVIDEGTKSIQIVDDHEESGLETPSTVSSHQSTLEDHCMILKGRVTAARYLPHASDQTGTFFRILFAESGNAFSVVQSKTPIYKSSVSDSGMNPTWSDGSFRFQFKLPETASQNNLTNHGGIVICLYRNRANGGSEFLGQVAVDFQNFVERGTTIERYGVVGREISGTYPIIDRVGQLLADGAEIDLHLELYWRIVPPIVQKSAIPLYQPAPLAAKKPVKRTVPRASKATCNASGAKAVMAAHRAYRREAEQRALNRANAAMQARLQKAGPAVPKQSADAYRAVEKKQHKAQQKESKAKMSASRVQSDLQFAHTALKRDVADAEKEVHLLRAQVGRMQNQCRKYEMTIERCKTSAGRSVTAGSALETSSPTSFADHHEPITVASVLNYYDLNEDVDSLVDKNLRGILVEHVEYQQMRRDLIARIANAKNKEASAVSETEQLKSKLDELFNAVDITRRKEQANARIGTQTQGWNLHSTIELPTNRVSVLKHDIEELRERRELVSLVGELHDNVENTFAREEKLKALLTRKENDLEAAKYKADMAEVRYQDMMTSKMVSRYRQSTMMLRAVLLNLKSKSTLAALSEKFQSAM